MLAFTAEELQVFDNPVFEVLYRVSIKDAGGTFRDYSTLEGINWQIGVDWDLDADQPIAAATVRLLRNQDLLSLSPLRTDSKLYGYIDMGREIKIETACVPEGTVTPSAGAWLLAFHGYIDDVDAARPEMELACRDLGSRVQLTIIETERIYSNATGTPVETVMQSILNDNGLSSITLYTPNSPGWNIKGFIQKKDNVFDALNNLAADIGWVVKYKYDSGTSTYRLTFFSPERAQSTSRHATLTGTSGNYITSPDSAAADVTGDLDLRALVAATDWTPAATGNIIAKWYTAGAQRSYILQIVSAGNLALWVSSTGVNTFQSISSVPTGFVDGTAHWVRATWRASDGRVQFFTSEDGSTWTQLGTDQTSAISGSLFNGTAVVSLGAKSQDNAEWFAGRLYIAEIYAGIGGTLKLRFDASDGTPLSSTVTSASTGEVWTLAGSTAIVGPPNISAGRYLDVKQLRLSRLDVRNAIQVGYYSRSVLDSSGNPTLVFVNVEDAASIAKYGRLWMGLTFAATDNIDTGTEATKMANSALADLKDPKAIQEVEMLLMPNIEPGDVLRFKANGVHYTADQDLAVTKVSHTIDRDQSRTTVLVRGRPSGSRELWFEMDARPGVAPVLRDKGPEAPTAITATPVVGGASVKFTPPVVGNWDMFELHASSTPGFTPSSATFRAQSTTDRFEVGDLTPGAVYYFQVVPRDALGNKGTASAEVSVTAAYAAPRTWQPLVDFGMPPNRDFEANSVSNAPPDTWTMDFGTWGTKILLESTNVYAGSKSIKFPSGTTGHVKFRSQRFSVKGGERVLVDVFFKKMTSNGDTKITPWLASYNADGTGISDNTIGVLTAANFGNWERWRMLTTLGATTRAIGIYFDVPTVDTVPTDVYIDSVKIEVYPPRVHAHYYRNTALGTPIANVTWTVMDFNTIVEDTHNAVTTGAGWKFTVPGGEDGVYSCAAGVGWAGMTAVGEMIMEFMVNGGAYMHRTFRQLSSASGLQAMAGATHLSLGAGDYVQVRVYQSNGAARNVEALREANWIDIVKVSQ